MAKEIKAFEESEKTPSEKVKIMIQSSDGIMGNEDVFVQSNGHAVLIKRDEVVTVTRDIYNALRDAVTVIYLTDAAGTIIGSRPAPRFNIQLIQE